MSIPVAERARRVAEAARAGRRDVLRMAVRAREGHIASAFSCMEILAALYADVLRVDPANPRWPQRDRFVMSKGHACAAHYAMLARRGFFPAALLETIGSRGTPLGGHPDHTQVPGLETSAGSLGHGLSLAAGMALAASQDGADWRVFALLSDGECQEGSTWEAALFAPSRRLDGLVAIVDYNRQQALGHMKDIVPMDPMGEKWAAFGWQVQEVDGHDPAALLNAFGNLPREGKPHLIVAHTVKGKGVSFMEGVPHWHARVPTPEELATALREIDEGGR